MIRRGAAGALVFAATGCELVFPPTGAPGAPDAPVDLARCPSGYDAVLGAPSRYRYTNLDTAWADAAQACAADTPDAITHLVVYDDFRELEAVRDGVPFPFDRLWAGFARDDGTDPTVFFAVTGGRLDRTSPLWEPGEPTGGSELATFVGDGFDLTDGPHDDSHPYICECDGNPATRPFDLP